MAKYNLQRIDLYVPQYDTDATISINESHSSGTPHLAVEYTKGGHEGRKEFAAEIPADWNDEDLAELISLPMQQRKDRNWPAWEIPTRDGGSSSLYRFWKGEKPPS
jgi:hypothetical protein